MPERKTKGEKETKQKETKSHSCLFISDKHIGDIPRFALRWKVKSGSPEFCTEKQTFTILNEFE